MTSIERILDHILFLARRFHIADTNYIIKILVLELGILPKYDGYRYLVLAIELYCDSSMHISVRELYSSISAFYNGSVDENQVEQAIRSAIKQAWKNRNEQIWQNYFAENPNGDIAKPSNGDFISTVACIVDLWKGWCRHFENAMEQEVDRL